MQKKNKTIFFLMGNFLLLFHFFFTIGNIGFVFKRNVFLRNVLKEIQVMYSAIAFTEINGIFNVNALPRGFCFILIASAIGIVLVNLFCIVSES